MAGPRGYRNYRGRTPKGKIVLAVVLVLVILAAVTVMILQQHIVYDESGRPHLELAWRDETPSEEDEPMDFELKIQAPKGPEGIQGFTVPVGTLTLEGWESAWLGPSVMPAPAYNAAVFTVKDSAGSVYFDSSTAVSGSVSTAEDTSAALKEMIGGDASFYTVARVSCFHDPEAANSDVEAMGLKNTGGFIFYDGNNSQWLDPGKPAARQYLCDIAREAAALGFDEILLTDVGYPTEGQLDKIDYGEGEQNQNLLAFLDEIRAALEPYSVALSIELPEVVVAGGEQAAGLTLAEVASCVDRVYAKTTPEEIARLSGAVSAASATTDFVAELEEYTPEVSGSCLIRWD